MVGGPETILLYIALILLGAKVGGQVATRLKQPSVVGEILAGIVLGPSLLGVIPAFEILDQARAQGTLSEGVLSNVLSLEVLRVLSLLGVMLLLFEVGLQSDVAHLRRVGTSALLVGTYGVLFSVLVGYAASWALAGRVDWVLTPTAAGSPHLLHLFIGATLAATSVGITARVLSEMNRLRTNEGQIILGAAVWDDVLGLVVLAVVSGLVVDPAGVNPLTIGRVVLVAIGFFVLALLLARLLVPPLIDFVHRAVKGDPHIHMGFAVLVMILVAYLATHVGLAALVGSFAAGLALSGTAHRHTIFEHVRPVGSLFASFFFVVLGLHVDLGHVTRDTIGLVIAVGALLTVVGILAKLAAGFGVLGGSASRYVVGIGMVPRGEVGLIFALFGLEHDLINNWQYTTLILVVLVTTVITPAWLNSAGRRFSRASARDEPGPAHLRKAVEP